MYSTTRYQESRINFNNVPVGNLGDVVKNPDSTLFYCQVVYEDEKHNLQF